MGAICGGSRPAREREAASEETDESAEWVGLNAGPTGPEPLTSAHTVTEFECGKDELTAWLRRYALQAHQSGAARVYVVHRDRRIVGYYALSAGSVEADKAPERVKRGLARHPIPVVLLARLAVDISEQRRGVGATLLRDALRRAVSAAETVGARAVLVHAKDEEARAFYEHFGFEPSPTDPLHLFLLMKDLRRAMQAAGKPTP